MGKITVWDVLGVLGIGTPQYLNYLSGDFARKHNISAGVWQRLRTGEGHPPPLWGARIVLDEINAILKAHGFSVMLTLHDLWPDLFVEATPYKQKLILWGLMAIAGESVPVEQVKVIVGEDGYEAALKSGGLPAPVDDKHLAEQVYYYLLDGKQPEPEPAPIKSQVSEDSLEAGDLTEAALPPEAVSPPMSLRCLLCGRVSSELAQMNDSLLVCSECQEAYYDQNGNRISGAAKTIEADERAAAIAESISLKQKVEAAEARVHASRQASRNDLRELKDGD